MKNPRAIDMRIKGWQRHPAGISLIAMRRQSSDDIRAVRAGEPSRHLSAELTGNVEAFEKEIMLAEECLYPIFPLSALPPNLLTGVIINIHAGVNAMKTLRRSIPNG